MTVNCQLHEAGCLLSVSYMGQLGCYLIDTWGRLSVSVSYISHVGCYLYNTWGRLSVFVSYMMQEDGYLSVT
jgi:hypothetical protein